MLEEIEKKFTWMLLLLPGFISLSLARYISDINDMDKFRYVFYSLILSFVNLGFAFILYKPGRWLSNRLRNLLRKQKNKEDQTDPNTSIGFILLVFLISIAVGIGTGFSHENDTIIKWLRYSSPTLTPSKRSHLRPLVFLLTENRKGELEEGRPKSMKVKEAWLEIHLNTDEIFAGHPKFFSGGDQKAEIFLSPACEGLKKEDGSIEFKAWKGPGVLINEKDIKYVAFVDRQKSECHNIWAELAGQN